MQDCTLGKGCHIEVLYSVHTKQEVMGCLLQTSTGLMVKKPCPLILCVILNKSLDFIISVLEGWTKLQHLQETLPLFHKHVSYFSAEQTEFSWIIKQSKGNDSKME